MIKIHNSKWLEHKLLIINELYKLYENQRTYIEQNYNKYKIIVDKLGCFKKGDKYYIDGIDRTESENEFLIDFNNIRNQVKQMRIDLIKLRDKIGIGLTSHIKLQYKCNGF